MRIKEQLDQMERGKRKRDDSIEGINILLSQKKSCKPISRKISGS